MKSLKEKISRNKLRLHLISFFLMILPPLALYRVGQSGSDGWIWILLGVVILGNVLAILVP